MSSPASDLVIGPQRPAVGSRLCTLPAGGGGSRATVTIEPGAQRPPASEAPGASRPADPQDGQEPPTRWG